MAQLNVKKSSRLTVPKADAYKPLQFRSCSQRYKVRMAISLVNLRLDRRGLRFPAKSTVNRESFFLIVESHFVESYCLQVPLDFQPPPSVLHPIWYFRLLIILLSRVWHKYHPSFIVWYDKEDLRFYFSKQTKETIDSVKGLTMKILKIKNSN